MESYFTYIINIIFLFFLYFAYNLIFNVFFIIINEYYRYRANFLYILSPLIFDKIVICHIGYI